MKKNKKYYRVYTNKAPQINVMILFYVLFILYMVVRYFVDSYELIDTLDFRNDSFVLACGEIMLLLVCACSMLYVLLNVCPRKIIINNERYEVVFLCGNRLSFDEDEFKILKFNESLGSWYAYIYVKKKFFLISSGCFPSLKRMMMK